MAEIEKLNIDSIIARLLEGIYLLRKMLVYFKSKLTMNFNCIKKVRNSKPGKNVQLAETEIRGLCLKSRELFLSQPILLELEAPLKICGKLKIKYIFLLFAI